MPLSSGDLLTLIPTKEVLRKPPNKRNHHHLGASSKPVSAGGGKKVSSGGGDGESEEGSSDATSQDDEDADDEDEDDQDDEKPAVKGPARVKLQTRKYIITENEVQSHIPAGQPLLEGTDVVKSNIDSFCTPKKKTPAIYNGNTTATENDTRAGQNPKKRSYSTASTMTAGTEPSDMDDAGVTETDEEPNYPRKRVARGLSTSNGYLQYSMNENDIHQDSDDSDNAIMEDTNDEDDEDDEEEEDDLDNVDIDDDLDEGALLDEDEKDIEKVEEAAIIRELDEKKCADNFNNVNTVLDNDFAFDGILSELDPALDPDFFDPRWLEPGAQGSELTIDQVLKSRDLFSVPGSQADSPELHGELGSPPPDLAGLLSSDGWSEFDADINYLDHNNPFFEKEDPAVKHVMNAKWNNNWLDDTDDEPDVWRYCIGSGDSSDDEGSDEASLAGDEEEEASEASEEEYDCTLVCSVSNQNLD